MAKRRAVKGAVADEAGFWESLTWDDLSAWAGGRSVARGRNYQRQGRVEDLAVTDDGRLLATVSGGEQYVVGVWCAAESQRDDPVQSRCTCPVGFDGCKHAVAVVAEYLERLADGGTVPTADPDDPRWAELESLDLDDQDDLPDEWDDALLTRSAKPAQKSARREDWDRRIAEHIRAKSRDDLVNLVISLTERYSDLREEFLERISLSEGNVDRLVAEARRKMREQTAEMGWSNSWTGEGYIPDYSGFRRRLERLVEMGHPDAVVDLGREFIQRAMQQVGQSHDEGETGMEVAECLPVIFAAVAQSSLSGPEQLLFAIDTCLEDDWGLIDDAADPIFDGDWTEADWTEVADRLQSRLDGLPAVDESREGSFSRNYERDRISSWMLQALEHAGRGSEARGVYEAEARKTGSYERLVRYLMETGDLDEACRWAEEGIAKTRDKWPGIASSLARSLRDIARSRKQWDLVAAHAACDFFQHPSRPGFDELLKAARKVKALTKVKAAALHFLETGDLPTRRTPQGKGKQRTYRIEPSPDWPLPLPEYLKAMLPANESTRPHFDVLLDMAIAAKKPEEVLHWHEKLSGSRKSQGRHRGWTSYGTSDDDRVAAAVEKSHPERALEMYTDGLNANLQHADPSAYDRAANYLKKMRPLLKKLGRQAEWKDLMEKLRQEYKRRRLFMEALDRVEGRTIVQSRKRRK